MAMDLDKWQQRDAQRYAAENEVSYEKAVFVLFGGEDPEPPAEVDPPVIEAEVTNPAEVTLTK